MSKSPVKKLSNHISKKEKLRHLYQLIKWVFPDDEPQDLSKVYVQRGELSEAWSDILQETLDNSHRFQNPEYLPTFWLLDARGDCYDTWTRTLPDRLPQDGYSIIEGKDALAMLNELKDELGPKPHDTLILRGPDVYEVVKLRDISHNELDYCVEKLQDYIKEQKEEDERIKADLEKVSGQDKLGMLVRKIGHDRTIEILEDEVEALKDGEK